MQLKKELKEIKLPPRIINEFRDLMKEVIPVEDINTLYDVYHHVNLMIALMNIIKKEQKEIKHESFKTQQKVTFLQGFSRFLKRNGINVDDLFNKFRKERRDVLRKEKEINHNR